MIGMMMKKIIDEKKLLLNLRYIFPDKNYDEIKKRIKKGKFFYFEKKICIFLEYLELALNPMPLIKKFLCNKFAGSHSILIKRINLK